MLIDDFYIIKELKVLSENEIFAEIKLNPEHKIYKGHFSGNPVVPGVVSVQIINEILSKHLKIELMVSTARSIKFTSMIKPDVNPNLFLKINYSKINERTYKTNAEIFFNEITFLKFKGNNEIIS